jgi:hypothetical protein
VANIPNIAFDAINLLAKIASLVLLAGGIASYFFREKIKQLLNRSLTIEIENLKKELNKELAEQAAQHQRDLEAYKVTLIAQAEQIKAAQEIKKSLALRIAERKFTAISTLLDAYTGIEVQIGAIVSNNFVGDELLVTKTFLAQGNEIMQRLQQLTSAKNAASPLLTLEVRRKLATAGKQLTDVLALRSTPATPPLQIDAPEIQAMFVASLELESALSEILAAMERLD